MSLTPAECQKPPDDISDQPAMRTRAPTTIKVVSASPVSSGRTGVGNYVVALFLKQSDQQDEQADR